MADDEKEPLATFDTVSCDTGDIIPYKANIATPTELEQLRFHYQQELKAIERSFQSIVEALECQTIEIPQPDTGDLEDKLDDCCLPLCPPMYQENVPGGPGGPACKVYDCSAYSAWVADGGGQFYWPCDNDPADGFLAGSVNLPFQGNYSLRDGAGIPDGCGTGKRWQAIAATNSRLEATGLVDLGPGSYVFSAVYRQNGGSTDVLIFNGYRFWRNSSLPDEVQYSQYLEVTGSTQPAAVLRGGGHVSTITALAPADSIPVGETAVISVVCWGPGDLLVDQGTYSVGLDLYINWTKVSSVETTFKYQAILVGQEKPDGTYSPGDPEAPVQFMGNSCDNEFSDMAINGSSSYEDVDAYVEEAKQAWDQNQAGYVDPDPTCVPAGSSTGGSETNVVTKVRKPEDGQILVWDEKNQWWCYEDQCCPPICERVEGGGSPGPVCKEYSCDAYHIYLSGSAQYYWPGDNPVSDGYLEGTVNLPASGGYTNQGPLFPDACVDNDGWVSDESAYLDGAEIFEELSTVGEYSFSTLYNFYSGNSDDSLLVHTLGWRYGSSGIAVEVVFAGYLNGDIQVRVDFDFGASSVPLNLVINNAIPNDGIPHVVGFTVGLPGETVPAGSTVPIPVSIHVDGIEVGTGEATGDFYNPGGDWVFAPDFPGQTNRIWFMAGSTNNYFSNMAINGGADDLSALRDAYLRNFTNYVDPDPECVPEGTEEEPVVIPPQDGDILVYDGKNECLTYQPIDWDSEDVDLIDDTKTALDRTWSSSKIQQQLDGKADVGALPVVWRFDGWKEGEVYKANQMTYDGPWLGVARVETSERLAPQPSGDPFNAYTADNTAAQSASAKQVIFGQRYNFDTGGWLTGYRVYTNPGLDYEIYLVTDPETNPKISTVLSFTGNGTGWTDFSIDHQVIYSGTSFDLIALVNEPAGTPTTWTGDWDYTKPNNEGVPGLGEIIHATRLPSSLGISKTDDALADRSAQLGALTVGDGISVGITQWTIQAITDNGDWIDFSVAPASQDATSGVQTFTFETVAETPIAYDQDTGYWSGNPNSSGLLGIDTIYGDITPNDHQYGLDIKLQSATIPGDWDIVPLGGA